jgi:hypothetical protein
MHNFVELVEINSSVSNYPLNYDMTFNVLVILKGTLQLDGYQKNIKRVPSISLSK